MNAIFFPIFDFVARNKWAQYLLLGLAVLATAGVYLAMRDADVRKREREKQIKKQLEAALKEQARIEAARQKLEETRTNEVQHAEQAAADHVVTGTVAELRDRDPGLAAIVYGSPRSRSGQAEGQ